MDSGTSSCPGLSLFGGLIGLEPPTLTAILRREPSTEGPKRRLMRLVTSSRPCIMRSASPSPSASVSIFRASESAWACTARRSLLCAGPFSFAQPLMNSLMESSLLPSPSIAMKRRSASLMSRSSCRMRHWTSFLRAACLNSSMVSVPPPSSSASLKMSRMLSSSCRLMRSSRACMRFWLFLAALSMCSTMTLTTMLRMPKVEKSRKAIQKADMYHWLAMTWRAMRLDQLSSVMHCSSVYMLLPMVPKCSS
mmetsp:Transcript_41577/g.109749  ORF Transcript_41577/g.109749 Transcript_41577/m.109749 type:complete len:251 (+) Transcript_41577:151-903(+)